MRGRPAPPAGGEFDILMVCLGNICRSPMMERLLRSELRQRVADPQAQRFRVHGAGTYAEVGRPIYPPAARALADSGVDPSDFAARQFTPELARGADLVITATADLRARVVARCPDVADRTFTLKELAGLLVAHPAALTAGQAPERANDAVARARVVVAAAHHARRAPQPERATRCADLDVQDPYGASDGTFRACRDEIAEALSPLVAALTDQLPARPSAASGRAP